MKEEVKALLDKMTLKQKASLLYGKKFWYLYGSLASDELPDIMLTDGPSGLRKQNGKADIIGLNSSEPATAFPTGSASTCSWDIELVYKMGQAIGNECNAQNVSVILGPAVNHKRDPLCGRNFEYLSEDPYLAGKMGAAVVNGIQSKGVGTSVKHFAVNSREESRMFNDSLVDERALREIYLKQFEIIVKESQPWTIMTAYNKCNGVHCAQNKKLMTDIARNEWGYEGLFLTDWGAMRDQIEAYNSGLDLETPGTAGSDEDIINAIKEGRLSEDTLNERAAKVIELLLKAKAEKPAISKTLVEDNLALAEKVAEESAVLLKNENILPLTINDDFAVIGAFAKRSRFQGGGSGKINPVALDNFTDYLKGSYDFAEGYEYDSETANDKLIAEAVEIAKKHKKVLLFVGLPDISESEGFDRNTLSLPDSHLKLIDDVTAVNSNCAVVLTCGAPVTMPWIDKVKAVLLTYLGGCQIGKAVYNLVFGNSNPCGKLAETFPICYEDTPAAAYYKKHEDYDEYRESIYTGYRYYETAEKKVLFPFGHGLSYTSYEYSDLKISSLGNNRFNVSVKVKNIGKHDGKEIVQLYVSHPNATIFKAKKELKAFKKVFVPAGESVTVEMELTSDAFSFYNAEQRFWQTEKGEYKILIGASSSDIRLKSAVSVDGDTADKIPDYRNIAPSYYDIKNVTEISEEEFLAYAKLKKPQERDKTKITLYSPIKDLQYSKGGKPLFDSLVERAKSTGDKANFLVAMDMPVMNMVMGSDRTRQSVYDFIKMANTEQK